MQLKGEAGIQVASSVPEEELWRSYFYGLLAQLLMAPPDTAALAALARLEGDATPIGQAVSALAATAGTVSTQQVESEYNRLFVGVTEGELIPYASYYLTGFLHERPLAELRWDMEALGIARAEGVAESEDHVAVLCEIMHGLIVGAFGRAADLHTQKRFFDTHLRPWAPKFFADLETAEGAGLYRPIGMIGRVLMAIEEDAFAMVG